MEYNKLIFVAQTGTCREAMAAGIMGDFTLRHPLEILPSGQESPFPPVPTMFPRHPGTR